MRGIGFRAALLLLAAALLGCTSTPRTPPEAPAGPQAPAQEAQVTPGVEAAPVTKAPVVLAGACVTAQPTGSYARLDIDGRQLWVEKGLCSADIGEEPADVVFLVPEQLDRETLQRRLKVSAGHEPVVTFRKGSWGSTVTIGFGPGQPGERLDVHIAGDGGAVGFLLTRKASPRVQLEYQVGSGSWQNVQGAATTPGGAITLRLSLSGSPDPAAVQQRVDAALQGVQWTLTKTSPEQFLVTVPEMPPRIDLNFNRVKGAIASVRESSFTLFSGRPPVLVTLDPSTGKEAAVGPAPLDAYSAIHSPDGKWAVLWTVVPGDPVFMQAWIVQKGTGSIRPTSFIKGPEEVGMAWANDRLYLLGAMRLFIWDLSAQKGETLSVPAMAWPFEPMRGRNVVGYSVPLASDASGVAAATVVLVDVEARTWRMLPDIVRLVLPGKEQYPLLRSGWSADGRSLIMGDFASRNATPTFLALDVETAKVAPHPGPIPTPPEAPDRLSGPTGWSYTRMPWGKVEVAAPGGGTRSWGTGLPVGWRPDGQLLVIRWPDEQYRVGPSLGP